MFFSAAERVHVAKIRCASRAQCSSQFGVSCSALTKADAELAKVRADSQ